MLYEHFFDSHTENPQKNLSCIVFRLLLGWKTWKIGLQMADE